MDKLFSVLADKKRRKIVRLIADKQMSVGEMEKVLGLKQSTLSSCLAVLRKSGLVKVEVFGRRRLYRLNGRVALKIRRSLDKLFGDNYMGVIAIKERRYSY